MKEVGGGAAEEPQSGLATKEKGERVHLVPVPVIHWPSPYLWYQ
jgi:hypothetical protein